MIYEVIDQSNGFYRGHADIQSRSVMNITFHLATPELEKMFLQASLQNNMIGLKGHRLLGGCRASLYNAVTEESCASLATFMKSFQQAH